METKRKTRRANGQEIRLTYDRLIPAVMTINDEPSAFQVLRRQPLPISHSLMLIEMGKAIAGEIDNYREALQLLQERHNVASEGSTEEFSKARDELLAQQVVLPGHKIPLALLSEAKISADQSEALLWLICRD